MSKAADALESQQILRAIEPITHLRTFGLGQKPDLVVVPDRLRRNPDQPRRFSDRQLLPHQMSLNVDPGTRSSRDLAEATGEIFE